MQKIDFHTHQFANRNHFQITSVFAQDLPVSESNVFFTAGIHPWHIGSVDPEKCLDAIEIASGSSKMLAIGECGLDRAVSQNFQLQVSVFKEQIFLSKRISKPLIIHCVRAFSDLIQLRKQYRSDSPWIIHGYRGNQETTKKLIKQGFYFSFGEALISDPKMAEVLKLVPTSRFFFETDESTVEIEKIYFFAGRILQLSDELLTSTVFNNFKTVFGNDWMVAKD